MARSGEVLTKGAEVPRIAWESTLGMVKVSGKAVAAGKIEANVSGAIPTASALPLTIVVSSPSQSTLPKLSHGGEVLPGSIPSPLSDL